MSAPIRTLHREESACSSRPQRDTETQRLLRAATLAPCPKDRQRLREKAAALNRDLALGVAYPFHGRGVDAEDIDQVALLGLWKAVLRYTPRDGSTFASYAIPTISGEVKRHFRDHGWAVRPPRSIQERMLALVSAADVLRRELQREPTTQELCRYLGVSTEDLTRASVARAAYQARSLDVRDRALNAPSATTWPTPRTTTTKRRRP